MSKLVSIPENLLAELLAQAGRTESVEQFVAALAQKGVYEELARFQKRAAAAVWSKYWLFLGSFIWVFSLLMTFSYDFQAGVSPDASTIVDVIGAILLIGMTVVEFYVCDWFKRADHRAIYFGVRNQCSFALLLFVYFIYQAIIYKVPDWLGSFGGGIDSFDWLGPITRLTYIFIAVMTAGVQLWVASYYSRTLPKKAAV